MNYGQRKVEVLCWKAQTGSSVRPLSLIALSPDVCLPVPRIDAIDNIQTKVDLLKYCHDQNIKVCVIHIPKFP